MNSIIDYFIDECKCYTRRKNIHDKKVFKKPLMTYCNQCKTKCSPVKIARIGDYEKFFCSEFCWVRWLNSGDNLFL